MQARRTARELALLSIGQLPSKAEKLQTQQAQSLLVAAVRTLVTEVQETLETASAELERGSARLLSSETRAVEIQSSRAMVREAIELTQTAINRMGTALELPELVQLANQQLVRDYALEVIVAVQNHRDEIDDLLNRVMVDWRLPRLARIDQDILRIAAAEIVYLGTPDRVAINEAIELAKRYSGEDGHRFINGILRRVSDELNPSPKRANPAPVNETERTE